MQQTVRDNISDNNNFGMLCLLPGRVVCVFTARLLTWFCKHPQQDVPPHWHCSILVAQCNHGKMRLRRMGRCRCTQIAKWLSEFALQAVAKRGVKGRLLNRGWYSHLMLQIKRQVCTLLLMLLIDGRAQLKLLSCVLHDFRSNKYCKERSFAWQHTSFNLANRGCSLNLFKQRLSISISTHTHTQCSTLIAFPENGDRSGIREGKKKKENCYLLFAQIVIKYLKIMPRAQEEICKEQRRREAKMREIFIFMRE